MKTLKHFTSDLFDLKDSLYIKNIKLKYQDFV